jgi:hypothetical protein
MNIEISEVYVIRTDAITTVAVPTSVGLAALQSRTAPIARNTRNRNLWLRIKHLCAVAFRYTIYRTPRVR